MKNLNEIIKNDNYFIYDLDGLLRHSKNIIQSDAKIFFACKANPLSHIINTLNKVNFNFDVASIGELSQLIKLGINGRKIILTGPAKSNEFIELAIKNKVDTIVIESENQLDLVQKISAKNNHNPKILIRVQIEWNLKQKNNYLGGNKITQFGFDINSAKNIIKRIKLPFIGFHVFQWSNILDINQLKFIWENTIKTCKKITENFNVLDFGGGIGIPYKNEKSIQWKNIATIIKDIKIKYNLNEFWLEMGRYLVGSYGKYVTKIMDIKNIYNKKVVLLNGGINHVVRPALTNEYFKIKTLNNNHQECNKFLIYGPLCTALDFLGEHKLPNNIKIGDIIILEKTGAYGFTESMPFFLCHNLPGEIVKQNNIYKIVRKPQKATTWLK